MDFLSLFIREQPDRLQIVRPALRLLGLLHFGAGQNQGDVLILALHLKLSVLRRAERAGAPRPPASSFPEWEATSLPARLAPFKSSNIYSPL